MPTAAAFYAALALALGGYVLMAGCAYRPWRRVAALLAFLLSLAASDLETAGAPKPLALEWRALGEGTRVVAASFDEPRSIYLWLASPGDRAPRAYALPWDERLAAQLHMAMREAQRSGTDVLMAGKRYRRLNGADRLNGVDGIDREKPLFYAAPQPARPEKQVPEVR